MKRILLLLTCVLTVSVVNAQEKKGSFIGETSIGTSCFGNYSAVSLFSDATMTYDQCPALQLSFGFRSSNNFFAGIDLGCTGGSTSFIDLNEHFSQYSIKLDMRYYYSLSQKIDLETGVAVGFLMGNNTFTASNINYSHWQYGVGGNLIIGLNYNINDKKYIGIKCNFPYVGSYIGDKPILPVGLDRAKNQGFIGSQLMISIGRKF